ncbi:MAG: glycosyltransferase [Anaerolineae bacterium]
MLRALNHARLPIQLVLVAGGDDELYDRFQAQTWHLPAQIYNFVEEMARFLIASDVIMSKAGGLIVSESLAAGLPMVLVNVLPGQEVGNAEHVVEGGAGVIAKDPISALETLWHWLDEDGKELRQRARAAEELGKPRAAEDVAQLALEAASGAVAKRRWAQEHAGRARLLAFLRRNGLLSDKPEGDEAAG